MKWLQKYVDRLLNLFMGTGVLVLFCLLLQVTVIATFRIPTDSMQPTLQPGDNILVNKTLMGARIFNIWDAAEEKEVEIDRLPGLGKVKRNAVLVFHYPYPHKNDSLSMHLLKYYVKRCIALPGDTMGIRQGHYYIKGIDEPIGNVRAQNRIARLDKENARGVVMDTYPWDKYMNWMIQDFGPLHVPARGQTVAMDSTAVKLYRNLIEWEQHKILSWHADKVFLGDSLIQEYRFKENYYFVGGDYMENSKDSRYWGLLPEPYIVGVATRIWKSVDISTGKIRWDRVMQKIE
ncbi:MAG: signal peptidase I [Paludibacteraceae bacterium]|nr:signal peptidase I [Bacteroidaceae bacterium]MBR5824888.1 signal peptidase I [Paludibacteraceae bacterium]